MIDPTYVTLFLGRDHSRFCTYRPFLGFAIRSLVFHNTGCRTGARYSKLSGSMASEEEFLPPVMYIVIHTHENIIQVAYKVVNRSTIARLRVVYQFPLWSRTPVSVRIIPKILNYRHLSYSDERLQ